MSGGWNPSHTWPKGDIMNGQTRQYIWIMEAWQEFIGSQMRPAVLQALHQHMWPARSAPAVLPAVPSCVCCMPCSTTPIFSF